MDDLTSGPRSLSIFGSTGSIGRQALEVVRASGGRFKLHALSANSSLEDLAGQVAEFHPAVAVVGSLVFISLSAGRDYTCGVTNDGVPFCWGHGTAGQLGTEDTLDLVPTRVHQIAGLTFAAVAAGGTHTCALTAAGEAYCWGQGTYGQLGTGVAPTASTVRGAVTGGLTFVALSVGTSSEHTCGVTPDSVTYCWGYSLYGQVGDGTTTNRPAPTRVAGQ